MGKFSDFMKKLYEYEEVDEGTGAEYDYDMGEYEDAGEDYETAYESFQEEVP